MFKYVLAGSFALAAVLYGPAAVSAGMDYREMSRAADIAAERPNFEACKVNPESLRSVCEDNMNLGYLKFSDAFMEGKASKVEMLACYRGAKTPYGVDWFVAGACATAYNPNDVSRTPEKALAEAEQAKREADAVAASAKAYLQR